MPKPVQFCSVPDCGARCHGRGLCVRHYKRAVRNGSPDVTRKRYRNPDRCEVPECAHAGPFKRGLCSLHYQRQLKHGDPLVTIERVYPSGEAHWMWVGDDAAYRTVHGRLDRERGKASTHTCECGAQAEQWAYDHLDPDEKVGVVAEGVEVPYSLDPAHYKPLCQPCHRRLDN